MRPLGELCPEHVSGLRGLLFDLDDTVLTHGILERAAYSALWDLHDAGLRLVAVTGRPAGWGEVLARQWPIDGVVSENGASLVARREGQLRRHDRCDPAERQRRRAALAALVQDIAATFPDLKLADDVALRETDVTWDVGEHEHVSEEHIAALMRRITASGARTTRSSVHVHASFEPDDKASGAIAYLTSLASEDAGAARARYAFVGDSGNDSACFAGFSLTFGVANVRASLPHIAVPPRFVARATRGAGFAEIARTLLQQLGGRPTSAYRT